jgi:hypothetical protein
MDRSMRRLEADELQHLLHADLLANLFEIDPGHGRFFLGARNTSL